jgi:hypothetical protein
MIVDHSIVRHQEQRQICEVAAQEIRSLLAERDELLLEVNRWRSAGGPSFTPRQARPVSQRLQQVLDVEKEAFGTFPNGFGENPATEGSGDQDGEEAGYHTAEDTGTFVHTILEGNSQDQAAPATLHQTTLIPDDPARSMIELPPTTADASLADDSMFDFNSLLLADSNQILTQLVEPHEPFPNMPPHSAGLFPQPQTHIDENLHLGHENDQFIMQPIEHMPYHGNGFTDPIYEPLNHYYGPFIPARTNSQTAFPT